MTEKTVIRTEGAPAPFEGAPYSQAIRAGDLVFVAGQVPIDPATGALVDGGIREQTDQAFRNVAAILEAASSDLAESRQDHGLPGELRRLRGHERVLRPVRRRPSACPLDRRGLEAPGGCAGRDRGRRTPVSRSVPDPLGALLAGA